MPENPNKLSQFWQELKRRNVHRSLAIYAGTAFVILEAADILFPRWGLPEGAFNLVLYLLILGAIITIIISSVFVTKLSVNKSPDESDVCTIPDKENVVII